VGVSIGAGQLYEDGHPATDSVRSTSRLFSKRALRAAGRESGCATVAVVDSLRVAVDNLGLRLPSPLVQLRDDQLVEEIDIDFDIICCPCGTGGTLAGIASGLREEQRAIGFSALKGGTFLNVVRLQKSALGRATQNWSIEHIFVQPDRLVKMRQPVAHAAIGLLLTRPI
jgi:hypothetical protein